MISAKKCQAKVARLDRQLLRNKADPNYMTQQFINSYQETAAEYTRLNLLIQEKQASEDDQKKAPRYYAFTQRNLGIYNRLTHTRRRTISRDSEPEKIVWSRLKEEALVKSDEFQKWFRTQFTQDGVWAGDVELNGCLHPFVLNFDDLP
ncbi:hypothetical protein Psal006b_03314 (plasmid) [Piscirickettsia salmonis]|uniref:Glucose-1-phosphate adenylyltransferase n=2 Tax=Piscirickettsia salmonis TaxID=1238 RepID=A0AAC8VLB6_PISSA|nr:glucose-1-phosphate adenylyltransferase [Piscirickettsia salmonis]QGO00277.1 hypothetical protein Psal006b_03314 [Piscirickettsia salmonis]QGO03874.1 hypothetical protein Psal008_03291 [Piscirickettsia salmonis]QGO14542.1 hypothetical protein Psal010b_03296 [Piscirickettsia salmonis]QGO21602.1 hypothetical protein Psal013_03298 [Piscirickettsia salmonis]